MEEILGFRRLRIRYSLMMNWRLRSSRTLRPWWRWKSWIEPISSWTYLQQGPTSYARTQVLGPVSIFASSINANVTHLERQKGGIGMRGPGETQIETIKSFSKNCFAEESYKRLMCRYTQRSNRGAYSVALLGILTWVRVLCWICCVRPMF